MSQRPVIHWFRRDLRLRDNIGLHEACATGHPIIALFIFDDTILTGDRVGAPRVQFLLNALTALDDSLQAYKTRLLIRRGDPVSVIKSLVDEVNAHSVTYNHDYTPYARHRDQTLHEAVSIPVTGYHDALLMPPGSVLKNDGDPYVVYTPFKNKWNEQHKPDISRHEFSHADFYDISTIDHYGIPTLSDLGFATDVPMPEATESAAHALLDQFIDANINRYNDTRNDLPLNPYAGNRPTGTSYLSPYLRLGLISPRTCYHAARSAYENTRSQAYRKSIQTWVSELTWREFYMHILHFFPHVLTRDFVDTYKDLAWRDAPDELKAWQTGQTGYPIIDAPMRQLVATGWMPNRARMIVASFLTKDLLIHWQHGDHFFMQHLIDGDPAANNGGWQWAAGTGTDAQPYFRIFNPISQSEKFATIAYLKHWIPELQHVPEKHIHTPWMMDNPPANYPPPIVDHSHARERTLQAFKSARGEK